MGATVDESERMRNRLDIIAGHLHRAALSEID
jgi:hypothetical protein